MAKKEQKPITLEEAQKIIARDEREKAIKAKVKKFAPGVLAAAGLIAAGIHGHKVNVAEGRYDSDGHYIG